MASEESRAEARQLSSLDHLISAAQTALTTIASTPVGTGRIDPAQELESGTLSEADKRESARLMRVNHVGEVPKWVEQTCPSAKLFKPVFTPD